LKIIAISQYLETDITKVKGLALDFTKGVTLKGVSFAKEEEKQTVRRRYSSSKVVEAKELAELMAVAD